jgi:hypothetical protein
MYDVRCMMLDVRCKKYEKVPIYYIIRPCVAQRASQEAEAIGDSAH